MSSSGRKTELTTFLKKSKKLVSAQRLSSVRNLKGRTLSIMS
jgi:hypothetical protein